MVSATRSSPYRRGRRFMAGLIAAMFVIVWGIPLSMDLLGYSFDASMRIAVPLGAAWVLASGVGALLIACPRCRKSLFMRGIFSVPWPEKTCGRCGTDLTSVPA